MQPRASGFLRRNKVRTEGTLLTESKGLIESSFIQHLSPFSHLINLQHREDKDFILKFLKLYQCSNN